MGDSEGWRSITLPARDFIGTHPSNSTNLIAKFTSTDSTDLSTQGSDHLPLPNTNETPPPIPQILSLYSNAPDKTIIY